MTSRMHRALLAGLAEQLDEPGQYYRVVQDGNAICIDGGINLPRLAAFVEGQLSGEEK